MEDNDMSDGEILSDSLSEGEIRPGTSSPVVSISQVCEQLIDLSLEMAPNSDSEHDCTSCTRARSIATHTKLGNHTVSEAVSSLEQQQSEMRAEQSQILYWLQRHSHSSPQLTHDDPNRYEGRGDGEVKKIGQGESYRPSTRPRSPDARYSRDRSRSPLRRDRVRTPTRERARTPVTDTYQPGARNRSPRRRSRSPLRRSRSPPYRARDRSPAREVPNWRPRERARTPQRNRTPPRAKTPPRTRTPARARSSIRTRSPMRRTPPRVRSPLSRTPLRRYSPRRDDDRRQRQRSPRRDELDGRDMRRRSKSPYDSRATQRARSPPTLRRTPPRGPRGNGLSRSRSPPRRFLNGPTSLTWRRRSPSPAPVADRSSGRSSASNSRISSPTAQLGRLAVKQPTYDDRTNANSPVTFDRSPLPFRETPGASRERSPIHAFKREEPRSPKPRSPPRGPAALRAPTGPSAARNFTAPVTSPTVSNSSGPGSAPFYHKHENSNSTFPPSGPRAYNAVSRGSAHPRGGRGSFSDRRSEQGITWGGAPPIPTITSTSPIIPSASPTSSGIPTGPRAASGGNSDWFSKPWATAAPRPSVHSTPPYQQRSQQPRVHPAIANLPQTIPGGRIDPAYSGLPKELEARIKKNDEDVERLREDLRIKQEKLRAGLRAWDKLERESKSWALKSELSERHLRILAGEGAGGAPF